MNLKFELKKKNGIQNIDELSRVQRCALCMVWPLVYYREEDVYWTWDPVCGLVNCQCNKESFAIITLHFVYIMAIFFFRYYTLLHNVCLHCLLQIHVLLLFLQLGFFGQIYCGVAHCMHSLPPKKPPN